MTSLIHYVVASALVFAVAVDGKSSVLTPAPFADTATTPLYSYRIGPQKGPFPNITAPLAAVSADSACDETGDALPYDGMIVAVTVRAFDVDTQPVVDVHDAIKCVENKGAVAAIVPRPDGVIPGYLYHLTNKRFSNEVGIVVVTVANGGFDDAIEHAENNPGDITMDLRVDDNPWAEVWDSEIFLIVWWVVFPLTNMYGTVVAGLGLTRRLIHMRNDKDPNRMLYRGTNLLLTAGCALEALACLIRFAHCYLGPLFSTHDLTTWGQFVFLSLHMTLEMITNLLACDLFIRWGAFQRIGSRVTLAERTLLALTAFALAVPIVLTAVTSVWGLSVTVIFISYGLALSGLVPTCALFLFQGRLLLLRLKAASVLNAATAGGKQMDARRGAQTRAVKWVMLSGAVQIITVLCFVALYCGANFHPWPFFVTMSLLFASQIFAAIASAHAFAPKQKDNEANLPTADDDDSPTGKRFSIRSVRKIFSASTRSMDMPEPNAVWTSNSFKDARTNTMTSTQAGEMISERSGERSFSVCSGKVCAPINPV